MYNINTLLLFLVLLCVLLLSGFRLATSNKLDVDRMFRLYYLIQIARMILS